MNHGRNRMGPREYAWAVFWVAVALAARYLLTGEMPWPTEFR